MNLSTTCPQIAGRDIPKNYKPKFRLLIQPGKLKVIAAQAAHPPSRRGQNELGVFVSHKRFSCRPPNEDQQEEGNLPLDFPPIPDENTSET